MLRLRHPVSLLIISGLLLLGVLRSFSPPEPVDAAAPDVVFSAVRAEAILRDLLEEDRPHVVGSQANAVVRDRVMAYFETAGYQPELQTTFHCNPMLGGCAWLQNIIATKPGAAGGHAVLVTAHYDSVWTGPGAADDGAAVAAILEIARMAADFPPFENDVVFLISDGEEAGLIGAHAFAETHPLFQKVKAVVNLEARGVTGPSGMFETGDGNRSVIRMFSKGVPRPVGNSLVYEMYRRMPNDTDYTVYKQRGVMGLNFAFGQGAALYHSALDDVNHLDLGSLQHHGDNAWGMLKALGERDLNTVTHREDAGYIDLFGARLIHYPVSIAGGLALVLGVWVMLAIGLAFRREFRYRQLRWGVVAIPLALVALVVGGYLLSWPLGRWPEMHPLGHPAPWVGRLTLLLLVVLVSYATLKVFTGRVSACAWMMLAWALVFVFGMVLATRLPAAVHLAVLPLFLFALGSVIDLFRKKSPAPLLMASVLGFAASAFVALYHFLMLELVLNFDRAHLLVVPLWLMPMTAMPMLLAFVSKRDLTWRPALWLLAALIVGSLVQLFLPGFTAERPRDMTLMYREVEGAASGHIVLESLTKQPDRRYARSHDFEMVEMDHGRFGTERRPAREVAALRLPGVTLEGQESEPDQGALRRRLQVGVPPGARFLELSLPAGAGLQKALVNGVLALDTSIESKHRRDTPAVRVYHPEGRMLNIELVTESAAALEVSALTWYELPGLLTAPFMGNWPDDAQPNRFGPRAEKIQRLELDAAE